MQPGKTLKETQDQLLIDMAVPAGKGCQRMKTNLGMVWIDYRKPTI